MKKILIIIISTLILATVTYFAVIYYRPYSTGVRSGELIKFSHKGYISKTWEGEISLGISGQNTFSFSVESKNKNVIYDLKNFQGKYVKVDYIERYKTFFWWGDSKYFVTKVEQKKSPHSFLNPESNEPQKQLEN